MSTVKLSSCLSVVDKILKNVRAIKKANDLDILLPFFPFYTYLGVVHKLRLQDEVGRWLSKCQQMSTEAGRWSVLCQR